IKDIDKELEIFVEENLHKIEPWYLNQQKEDDLVISASPYFLVKAFLDKIDVKHLIASNVDKNTGKYTGLNCYGEEKVKRYREVYNNKEIEEFYSDSLSDTPMAKISKNAFFVTRGKITNWKL
ncbi:MAG: haloacid dehalogenase-like hydrolase, partial [Erysipelotrichaceae bacterium]